jgi:hypothetical protein
VSAKVVEKGKVWVMDRRTTRRYFLFRPDEQGLAAQIFWYCLAVTAAKHGVIVHAAVLMSNHIHLVITDVYGVQPHFKRDFHRLFACCMKATLGWPGEVFDKTKGGEHEPLNEEALIKDIAYLIANPPSCLAVRYARDWPGAKTLPQDIGRRVVRVERPDGFLDPENPEWPDVAELELAMEPTLEDKYGAEGARQLIAEQVKVREQKALAESKRRGIPFKGARRVMRVPHTARGRSYETFGAINPRFSAAGDREAAVEAVRKRRQFDADYDRALARWTTGDRRVQFPHGTWWMRVHHGARCRPPP